MLAKDPPRSTRGEPSSGPSRPSLSAIRVWRIRGADPLPDVPGHVERSVGARSCREAADDRRRPSLRAAAEGRLRPPHLRLVVAPRVEPAVRAAGGLLPLGLGRQASAAEATVRARVEPVDVGHRVLVEAFGNGAVDPVRRCVMARRPHEGEVLRVRHRGRRELECRHGDDVSWCFVGEGDAAATGEDRSRARRRPRGRRRERDRATGTPPARTRGESRRNGRPLRRASRGGRSSESRRARDCRFLRARRAGRATHRPPGRRPRRRDRRDTRSPSTPTRCPRGRARRTGSRRPDGVRRPSFRQPRRSRAPESARRRPRATCARRRRALRAPTAPRSGGSHPPRRRTRARRPTRRR